MASEPDKPGPDDDAKTIAVRIFTSGEAAQVAATNLEAHGIECWITSDDAGGMLPNLSAPRGVRLLVRASKADEAAALLESQASSADPNQP